MNRELRYPSDQKPVKSFGHLFKENEIVGLMDTDLSAEFAERVGIAFAQIVKSQTQRENPVIAVGWDFRVMSTVYAAALIDGIRKLGVDVVRTGVSAVSVVNFSVQHLSLDAAFVVTGSHHPPTFNGFRGYLGNNPLSSEDYLKILKGVSDIPSEILNGPRKGRVGDFDAKSAYLQATALPKAETPRFKKIVIDTKNGTASLIVPDVFKKLGAELSFLFCSFNPDYVGIASDVSRLENLWDLVYRVRMNRADFGLAFDSACENVVLVDERGKPVSNYLLRKVVATYGDSEALSDAIKTAVEFYKITLRQEISVSTLITRVASED